MIRRRRVTLEPEKPLPSVLLRVALMRERQRPLRVVGGGRCRSPGAHRGRHVVRAIDRLPASGRHCVLDAGRSSDEGRDADRTGRQFTGRLTSLPTRVDACAKSMCLNASWRARRVGAADHSPWRVRSLWMRVPR